MGKKQRKYLKEISQQREEIYNTYLNNYYNLFMSAYEWEGLDPEQIDYLMRKFWKDGRIWAFRVRGTDELILTPFSEFEYNIYDFPIKVIPINIRGVAFIPNTPQEVNLDGVIGYVQKNKKGVWQTVDYYCRLITDIEMVIRTNLALQKMPWAISCSPEDEENLNEIFESIMNDEIRVFLPAEQASAFGSVVNGAPYIIDKLYAQKQAYENELLTYLGVNNMGTNEKKEHLINAEVEANNQLICHSSDNFIDSMETFCEQVKDVLGLTISVSPKFHVEQFTDSNPGEEQEVEEDE